MIMIMMITDKATHNMQISWRTQRTCHLHDMSNFKRASFNVALESLANLSFHPGNRIVENDGCFAIFLDNCFDLKQTIYKPTTSTTIITM